MKKSLVKILSVINVFKTLMGKRYTNFAVSFAIAKAAKELDSHREFYAAEEKKIVESYAVKDKDGKIKITDGNRIEFKDQKDAVAFNEEITKLQKTEVEIFEPIKIKLSDFKQGEMDLTPNDILALEDFVVFVDDTKVEA